MRTAYKLNWVFTSCLFILIFSFSSVAQTASRFGEKGDSAYTAKNYPLAIDYYTKQQSLLPFSFQKRNVWYNMACNYALSGDKENAWNYLNKSLDAGYNNYPHILKDTDLDTLHSDKQWKKFTALNKKYQKRMRDPRKAELVTTDIHNFWDAYDRVQKDTAHAIELYNKYYFEKASPGLQDYFTLRIFSVEYFLGNQKVKKAFYRSIRPNTLRVDEFKTQMKRFFVKLKEIYDDAIFPNVYFVIGRWNSAGTVSSNGLLIGTDMMSKSDIVPLNELSLWEKNNFKPIDNLPYIVAHELIHSQQNNMKNDTTTLWASIREGMCDFLGEFISGKSSNPRLLEFAKGKEKQIWKDFEKDMYLKRAGNWIANAMQETPEHPADLGYWMGYQICRSYYEEMADKKQAVYDMLHIKDYKDFLAKSRYVEKLGL
ncbi:MAG TPA: DUF2268 domain-containing putative Zn-dependent protease [Chitinophagaceae bacterium]|nr:DUF2268 domain-containing putative Zn-dependent protease [Chitinophagaceae bacterium]